MHSHHSHSGDYVAHAKDGLDDVVAAAAANGFTHFCLTEHMPRLQKKYIYPEEIDLNYSIDTLVATFEKYLQHAHKIQCRYNESLSLKVLIGFEVEGIDQEHIDYAKQLMKNPIVNMTVGSVHFVNLIPIDFDQQLWLKARESLSENTTRQLYSEYFETQYKVISTLEPTVIGHFDLIRLFEPSDETDPTTGKKLSQINLQTDWPEVWHKAIRNIEYVVKYGGLFELNSSAIRKGWDTPYPRQDFAEIINELGGRFCLSDDSHGLSQIGLNYHKVLEYIRKLGLSDIYHLDLDAENRTIVKQVLIGELEKSPFWKQYS